MKRKWIPWAVCGVLAVCCFSISALNSSDSVSAVQAEETESIVIDTEDTVETWNSSTAVKVQLNGDSVSASGSGISVSGTDITISMPGVYVFSGTLNDGTIRVDCQSDGTVQLILNDASITSSDSAAIYVAQADKTILTVAEGTENSVTDGTQRTAEDEDLTAAIFSSDDLVINGSGTLLVEGSFNDGIVSKDSLILLNASLDINSADDGIIGKDSLSIENCEIKIIAQGDGLKASNDTDAGSGIITIKGGDISITSGDDGIQAVTSLTIVSGNLDIEAGGGCPETVSADSSQMMMQGPEQNTVSSADEGSTAKGMVCDGTIEIQSGTIILNTADDAIHSSSSDVTVSGGSIQITAGDDAVHAENQLTVNDGNIEILKCYEGLEGASIALNGGTVSLIASDDGINASGTSGSSTGMQTSSETLLTISGGTYVVDAGGDGIDVNGGAVMTGGSLTVYGPENSGNGALDYDSSFTVTGGTILAGGATGMVMTPSDDSTVYTISIGVTDTSGPIVIKDSSGNEILSYSSSKSYGSLVAVSDQLKQSETYSVYQNGTLLGTVTLDSAVSYVNSSAQSQNTMNGGGMQKGNRQNMPAQDSTTQATQSASGSAQ